MEINVANCSKIVLLKRIRVNQRINNPLVYHSQELNFNWKKKILFPVHFPRLLTRQMIKARIMSILSYNGILVKLTSLRPAAYVNLYTGPESRTTKVGIHYVQTQSKISYRAMTPAQVVRFRNHSTYICKMNQKILFKPLACERFLENERC